MKYVCYTRVHKTMFDIFKWFFGIVGVIILAYLIILAFKGILSFTTGEKVDVGTSTSENVLASTTTTFKDWLQKLYTPAPFAAGGVVVEHRNPIADKILNAYSDYDFYGNTQDDFDTRWGGQKIEPATKSNDQQVNADEDTKNTGEIKTELSSDSVVENNQIIYGSAKEEIFNERSFPITILDQNKKVIGSAKVFVNGEVKKDGFIPFRGVISFIKPTTNTGYMMLNNESNIIKINFTKSTTIKVSKKLPGLIFPSPKMVSQKCVVAGCSMQFCVEQNDANRLVSTCEYNPSYSCYRNAVCERNTDTGKCGWKIDNTLAACLQNM